MKKKLLAHPLLRSALLLLLALLARPAMASHLLGGELTYRFVDALGPASAPLRYELTLTVYTVCNNTVTLDTNIGIYERSTGARVVMTTVNYPTVSGGNINVTFPATAACNTPAQIPGCTITGPSQPFSFYRATALVNLPNTTAGFYAAYSSNARTSDILNLDNPGSQNLEIYTLMAPPTVFNRSPVFANTAVAVICANDTTYYLNNAIDADGDELEYSFGQPYSGALPTTAPFNPAQPLAPYATTNAYSATTPFGVGRGIINHLNSSTGIATFSTPVLGKYAVAVDVREYRIINGVRTLLGSTRRDVQLVVANCPSTPAPVLPAPIAIGGTTTPLPRNYTIEAGTTQTIPITATQKAGNPLTMTVSSALLDGPGGYDATVNGSTGTAAGLAGAVTANGNGSVVGTFVYKASCTEARTQPYDIAVTVKDNGCAGKTIYDVFRITVVKPQGPTAITGNLAVCGVGGTTSYTATGGTTAGVSWTVTGGTIVGSATANPVQVQWSAAGPGTLTVNGVSAAGCITDAVTQNVVVSAAPTLTIAGNRNVCQGASTTLTVSGGPTGAVYTVTGGPVSGTSPTFVLTPTATTIYTITAPGASGACAATSQVTITVNPAVTANAGPAVSTTNGRAVAIGAAPVAGFTYSWSPTTGLSNPTSANPTVTLPNTTGTPITQTYTLTTTSTATGCSGTASVVVTVGVDPNIEVANVITPNGDKLNDWLQVKNVNAYPNNTVEIFNRWGRRVFSTQNYNNTTNYWGTDPSIAAGMYYYTFTQPNGSITRGWVEVIK
ncbi:MAG TPA: gliding motility-associated C-terminal domain-containing protein [Hymenobacter sp.]|uniref:T9SS type B sorting domain-containing protein n=1 Tax=Hymenobacter sp. TaxID=1898978 RepID=UPI002D80060F|nr:gliding motility-associated C-terminal domain-containing protein [Hymenobacter sp.]HET9505576.1 gliding motility-associated C-terminal domain-containing protein [Hymenobacter sp.]